MLKHNRIKSIESKLGRTDSDRQHNRAASRRGIRATIDRRHGAGAASGSATKPGSNTTLKTIRIPIASIVVPKGSREIDQDEVFAIAESITKIGLQTPIQVRSVTLKATGKSHWRLVSGQHRIEAMKLLKKEYIEAFVVVGGKDQARLRTIAENLFRADLTVLERAEHIVEWGQRLKGAQSEHPRGGKQPHDAGVSRIAGGLGISRAKVWRAQKIAAIDPKAKVAAKAAGLDNSLGDLLAIAEEATSEAKLAKVRELENKQSAKQKSEKGGSKTLPGNKKSATSGKKGQQAAQGQRQSTSVTLVNAWKRAKTLNQLWACATIADRQKFFEGLRGIEWAIFELEGPRNPAIT
ncbi:MAG: ParB/RepB/Spo0J family partition protein [Xanthobacteraceae bacterium]